MAMLSEGKGEYLVLVEILLGDPYGIYLTKGWHYLGEPLNTIFIVKVTTKKIKKIVQSLDHEILHHILSNILSEEESFKANYGLDMLIFVKKKFSCDLKEVKA